MSKKRRRKRPAGTRAAPASGARGQEVTETRTREEPEPRPRGRAGWGAARPSPYPPLGISLARGLRVVGSSPVIVAGLFLSTLVTWGVFVLVGAEPDPRFMVAMMSLAPVHAFFPDVPVVFQVATGAAQTLALLVGLGVMRAVTFGFLLLLIDDSLRHGATDMRSALRRLTRVGVTLAAVYVIEVTLVVLVQQLVVGLLGGQFYLLAVAVALYFLVMVPVVAAMEDTSAQDALRRGYRASRLPGVRHLSIVVTYFLVFYLLNAITPGAVLAPATPGLLTWAFVLLAAFAQLAVLAALCYRWHVVRDQVPKQAPARRGRR